MSEISLGWQSGGSTWVHSFPFPSVACRALSRMEAWAGRGQEDQGSCSIPLVSHSKAPTSLTSSVKWVTIYIKGY